MVGPHQANVQAVQLLENVLTILLYLIVLQIPMNKGFCDPEIALHKPKTCPHTTLQTKILQYFEET